LTDIRGWIVAARTLLIAFAGGLLATLAGVPAGWLSGAMIAVTVAAIAGLDTRLPRLLADASFVLVGAMLGAGVTPEIVGQAAGWPVTLAGLVLSTLVVVVAVRAFLVHVARWDAPTALFAALPGALSYVMALATESHADVRRVAVSQTMRLFLLVALIPPLVAFAEGERLVPLVRAVGDPLSIVLTIAVAAAGGLLLAKLRVPAGLLTGSIFASAFVHVGGWVDGGLPAWMINAAFVVLGALIGGRFAGTGLRFLRDVALAGAGAFVVALGVSWAFAWAVSLFVDVPPVQILVAFAPGGLDAMTALAIALHLDSAFVAIHQLVRFMAIAMLAPAVTRRWSRSVEG
jgi:membrane AbrB-like protein